MFQDEISCAKCGGRMEEGFIVDRGHYNTGNTSVWIGGAPEISKWTGMKTEGRKQLKVVTFRCVTCGYLESYANEEDEGGD